MIHFQGVEMKKEHIEFVSRLFPFVGLKKKTLEVIFSDVEYSVEQFQKGEVIFSPSSYQKKIGFVISGECEVSRERSDEDLVPLNTLSRYSSFGIMAILCENAEYPTRIIASKPSVVLFINGSDMLSVIKKYPTVSMNVIAFLADRISFLNKKIATFSGKSTLEKLVTYLLDKYHENGECVSTSKTKLSLQINVGRASLYRDLDALEADGLIRVESKRIIIISPEGLERITK